MRGSPAAKPRALGTASRNVILLVHDVLDQSYDHGETDAVAKREAVVLALESGGSAGPIHV